MPLHVLASNVKNSSKNKEKSVATNYQLAVEVYFISDVVTLNDSDEVTLTAGAVLT